MAPRGQQSNAIAIILSDCYGAGMADDPRLNLGANLKRLRETRALSQEHAARLAGIPRATWASLESGSANPTLVVLTRVADALAVTIEELIGAPRTAFQVYRAADIAERRRQGTRLRPLVPEAIPGLEVSRMEFSPGGALTGVPHTPGTREYLTCEQGRIELAAAGERWELAAGDVLVFRGDQRHGYRNLDSRRTAVAISVVCFARTAAADR